MAQRTERDAAKQSETIEKLRLPSDLNRAVRLTLLQKKLEKVPSFPGQATESPMSDRTVEDWPSRFNTSWQQSIMADLKPASVSPDSSGSEQVTICLDSPSFTEVSSKLEDTSSNEAEKPSKKCLFVFRRLFRFMNNA